MDHGEKLQHVRRVRALGDRKLPGFKSHGQEVASVVGLGQNGGNGQLGRIRGEDSLAVTVPEPFSKTCMLEGVRIPDIARTRSTLLVSIASTLHFSFVSSLFAPADVTGPT